MRSDSLCLWRSQSVATLGWLCGSPYFVSRATTGSDAAGIWWVAGESIRINGSAKIVCPSSPQAALTCRSPAVAFHVHVPG